MRSGIDYRGVAVAVAPCRAGISGDAYRYRRINDGYAPPCWANFCSAINNSML